MLVSRGSDASPLVCFVVLVAFSVPAARQMPQQFIVQVPAWVDLRGTTIQRLRLNNDNLLEYSRRESSSSGWLLAVVAINKPGALAPLTVVTPDVYRAVCDTCKTDV
jgi:hypothetical protein